MKHGLDYTIKDEQLKEHYEELRKSTTTEELRDKILELTAQILDNHKYFENAHTFPDEKRHALREKELIGVITVLHSLISDLESLNNASRTTRLKQLVLGR